MINGNAVMQKDFLMVVMQFSIYISANKVCAKSINAYHTAGCITFYPTKRPQ